MTLKKKTIVLQQNLNPINLQKDAEQSGNVFSFWLVSFDTYFCAVFTVFSLDVTKQVFKLNYSSKMNIYDNLPKMANCRVYTFHLIPKFVLELLSGFFNVITLITKKITKFLPVVAAVYLPILKQPQQSLQINAPTALK